MSGTHILQKIEYFSSLKNEGLQNTMIVKLFWSMFYLNAFALYSPNAKAYDNSFWLTSSMKWCQKLESKGYERIKVWPHFPVMCMHSMLKRISYEIATLPSYEEANLHEGKSISCLHHLVKIKV